MASVATRWRPKAAAGREYASLALRFKAVRIQAASHHWCCFDQRRGTDARPLHPPVSLNYFVQTNPAALQDECEKLGEAPLLQVFAGQDAGLWGYSSAQQKGGGQTQGSRAMKCSKRSFAVISVLFALLLSLSAGTLNARDAASHTFAAAQTAKQKCINTCRARYRDCLRLNQLPSFECRGVYRDCTRYACTGLGPG